MGSCAMRPKAPRKGVIASCSVRARAPSRQDTPRRLPQQSTRCDQPPGHGWCLVHLSRLLPRMGKVAEGEERGVASDGLAAVSDWCRENRHKPIREQHAHLTAMMRGHYAYFGCAEMPA